MRKNKIVPSSIFCLSALCFICLFFPLFSVQTEGVFRAHLVRVTLLSKEISTIQALFGSSNFGVSAVSWVILILIITLNIVCFINLFSSKKWIGVISMALCLSIFVLTSAETLIYSKQYGINTWNYLSSIENYYSYETRIITDTHITRQALYIQYGTGSYMLLVTCFVCFSFSFYQTRILFLKSYHYTNRYLSS